jgi:hypothetical protein
MTKCKLIFTIILSLVTANVAIAAPNLAGKTFVLSGKLTGSVLATCNRGGTRERPIKPTNSLSATLTFNPGNTFLWTDIGSTTGSASNAPGFWIQKRNLINLEYDDDSQSMIKAVGEALPLALTQLGAIGTVKNTKYSFFATPNPKGNKLIVTESGAFKVKGSGEINGKTITCTVRINLKRVYKGVSVS